MTTQIEKAIAELKRAWIFPMSNGARHCVDEPPTNLQSQKQAGGE